MSLDGVKEIFLKSGEPGAGINPDPGFIYKWIEQNGADFVYKYKDSAGNVGNIGTMTAFDPDAIHDNVADEINQITAKASPVDNDLIIIEDSADSFNKNKVTLGSISQDIDLANQIYVSKSGNDSNTGGLADPFLTVKAAVDFITAQVPSISNQFSLTIGPGSFTELPMTVPSFVEINGQGARTTIVASNPLEDLMTIREATGIRNLTFQGVTGTGKFALKFSSVTGSGSSIQNVFFFFCSNGLLLESAAPTFTLTVTSLFAFEISENVVQTNSDTQLTVQGSSITSVSETNTVAFNITGNSVAKIYNARPLNCDVGIICNSSGEIDLYNFEAVTCTIPLRQLGTGEIVINGADLTVGDAEFFDASKFVGYITNRNTPENQVRMLSELTVGTPALGLETTMGEGDNFEAGLLCFTFNGSTFANVSTDAKAGAGTVTFPNTNVDSAIYISTAIPTTVPYLFYGIRIDQQTAAVKGAGDIVGEFWNGSSWQEFNHVSTETTGKYLPFAKQIFERTGIENVRFDSNIGTNWTANDPVSLGQNFQWVRFRIIGATITTAPVFNSFRIGSNHTEVNEDGYVEYFGLSRPVAILPFDVGSLQAAGASPGNTDLGVGDNIFVGRIENNFQSGTTDRAGLVRPFPLDICTACPIKLVVYFMTNNNDTTPNFTWVIRWTNTEPGDPVYDSTADSPTTALRQQTVTLSVPNAGQDVEQTFEAELDISDIIPRRESSTGDLFWLSIQRSNDGNSADCRVIQFKIEYTRLSEGGHQ